MRERNLAVVILQKVTVGAMQHAGRPSGEACGVLAQLRPASTRFDANESNAVVSKERIEHPYRVAAATDASEQGIGQPLLAIENLRARFVANHAMKIAHHQRVRVR